MAEQATDVTCGQGSTTTVAYPETALKCMQTSNLSTAYAFPP